MGELLRQLARELGIVLGVVAADGLERMVHAVPILQPDGCNLGLRRLGLDLRDADDAAAVWKRQRPQQHGIDGRKDGAIGAYAQCQGQDDGEGKRGRFGQGTQREPHVAQCGIESFGDIHISGPFDVNGVVAKLLPRQAGGGFGVHSGIPQFFDTLGDVEAQFALQVLVQSPRTEGIAQPGQPFTHSGGPCQRPR